MGGPAGIRGFLLGICFPDECFSPEGLWQRVHSEIISHSLMDYFIKVLLSEILGKESIKLYIFFPGIYFCSVELSHEIGAVTKSQEVKLEKLFHLGRE